MDVQYDKANRLVTVAKNGQTIGQYSYDAVGKREKKVENSVTTIYVYRGLAVLYEKTLDNSTIAKYVYGPNGWSLILMVRRSLTGTIGRSALSSPLASSKSRRRASAISA